MPLFFASLSYGLANTMTPFPQAELILKSQITVSTSVLFLHSLLFPGPGKDGYSVSLEFLSFSLPFTSFASVTLPVSSRLPASATSNFTLTPGSLQGPCSCISFSPIFTSHLCSPHMAAKQMFSRQEDNYSISCLSLLVPESLWGIKV